MGVTITAWDFLLLFGEHEPFITQTCNCTHFVDYPDEQAGQVDRTPPQTHCSYCNCTHPNLPPWAGGTGGTLPPCLLDFPHPPGTPYLQTGQTCSPLPAGCVCHLLPPTLPATQTEVCWDPLTQCPNMYCITHLNSSAQAGERQVDRCWHCVFFCWSPQDTCPFTPFTEHGGLPT